MNIGIIVYSHTGNTLSVAERLQKKLEAAGHQAALEKVSIAGGVLPKDMNFKLESAPPVRLYDAVVFASPVQAFNLAMVMSRYLKDLPTLQDKKTICFVTQQFKHPFLGGNNAINKMKKLCLDKGALVPMTGIINWTRIDRETRINELTDSICREIG